MTRLGYQFQNYFFPGTPPEGIVPIAIAQACEAEAAGFDRVFAMDHLLQLPTVGAHDEPILECYSLLAALAQHTKSVRLASLVTSNTFREPTLLAKTVTTLDHLSNGRATLGIGAGWFQLEHDAMGYEFGSFTDRFDKLEEALQIVLPMLRGDHVTFAGKHYRANDAVNSPAPISRVPVMIGGSGEKKTLRLAATYADESNLGGCPVADIPRKLDALAAHCAAVGRDRAEIAVTTMVMCCIAPTMEQADEELRSIVLAKGYPLEVVDLIKSQFAFGDPDTAAAYLQAHLDTGVDGLTLVAPVTGHIPGRIALLGETALALFR